MNARIQRWQLVARLLLSLLVFGWGWRRGEPGLGLALAALVFWFHALVMLALFASLRRLNRAAPPSWPQLLRAWWGELIAVERVFAWQQPFAEHAITDFVPPTSPQRGVLLLHGFTCNRGIWNSWRQRLTQAGHPHVALSLEPAFGSIDEHADAIEAAVQRLTRCSGRAPLIVAHSMGGLAARAWWRRFGAGRELLPRIVCVGTPHQGTAMASFSLTTNSQQMRRNSAWLLALAATEPAGFGAQFDCYFSACDQIVCPTDTALLPGARAIGLAATGHLAMVFHPRVWADVLALLRQP